MPNRNALNNHNNNIRSQGGFAGWVSDINDEIYQNLDQLEIKDNIQQNQINQILNSELPTKQNQINDHENRIQNQQNILNNISSDLTEKQVQINQITSTDLPSHQSKIDQYQIILNEYGQKIKEFDEKIKSFTQESVASLGVHFAENYKDLKEQTNSWLKGVWIGFGLLILIESASVIYLIMNSGGFHSFYILIPITIVCGSLLYFLVAQYSQYKKLALEYKNRQVVAQYYLGILANSIGEQQNIITTVVADTLFSRNVTDQGSDLPIKDAMHLAEKMFDTASNVVKK